MLLRPWGRRWSAIVPVRDFRTAKARLRADLPDRVVTRLARGLALGTMEALHRCEEVSRVLVVSDADMSPDVLRGRSSLLIQQPGGGLNGAVEDGLARLRAAVPDSAVLVLHADLPRVNAAELTALIRRIAHAGKDAYLPDTHGTGTTALAFLPGSQRRPAFGPASAARHEELGFTRVNLAPDSGLRVDLDSIEDLALLQARARLVTPAGASGRGYSF